MNNYLRSIMEDIARSDIKKARTDVLNVCENNTTKADQNFCAYIKNKLNSSLIPLSSSVPQQVREFVSESHFNAEQYYLPKNERELANKIERLYAVSQKLIEKDIQYLNSILLFGPSGTGKTMFGKYIAWKLGLPFLYLNLSKTISSYLGNTAKNIATVFEFANNTPSLLMLDEIDAIALKRGSAQEVGEISRIAIAVMQALDNSRNDLLVIGATNRPDIIDEAVSRRFTLKHEFEILDFDERLALIKHYLAAVQFELSDDIQYIICQKKTSAEIITETIQEIARKIELEIEESK